MSRRSRFLVVGSLIILMVGIEVAVSSLRGPLACVEVVNHWSEPIEDLRVSCDTDTATISKIEPGASGKVYLAGRGKQNLRLRYRQKGNGLTDFEVVGFNPAMLREEGFKVMFAIRQNEYERYQEEADPSLLARFGHNARIWFEKSLEGY